ncbi:DNA polymerase III alpha subunit [Naumannella cuiyingiana]|uniref:DNA polymerase III alpha subunit n=1 Tax=Naumannella cuiyingiana TaxID=1347891 RepID=A0A7Z0D5Y7_9ACTN|nr:DNA polymerase III alpha subunit [Naumannella cuiyingiana]
MGKKKAELDKQFEAFSAGMHKNGYGTEAVQAIWDILLPFSDYAFNKAHSAPYGLLSYLDRLPQSALPPRVHGSAAHQSKDKMALYLNETRRMGIKVLPPDVNESVRYFAAVGDDVRFGLEVIRNVGAHVVGHIIDARENKGRFEGFHDFLRKVPPVVRELRDILTRHPGDTETRLKLTKETSTTVFTLPPYPVTVTGGLHAEVKVLLGPNGVESSPSANE